MEFGETAFPKYGSGSFVQSFPQTDTLEFGDFSGGLFLATNREDVPPNTTPNAIDIEVTSANRLRRAPGTTVLEVFEDRTPEHFIVHGSLDFTAELIFFDPPYLGVKRLSSTEWANKALSSEGFAWANFGGTLIFTDGVTVYARQVNDGTTITPVPEAPVALAYASWAARMWALAAVIDGNFEPLGLVWSAADSDYTDWTGIGAGNQLLIDQISSGDRGVALVPMGLDFMAVFLRKSIWIARRTGTLLDPGDLQPRVAGKGAINPYVCQATSKGVIYVTDSGVEIFDGNVSTHISFPIDAELVPLDYEHILNYTSSYNPTTERYYLHSPSGVTWIYELEFNRWFKRSLDAIESLVWPQQALDAVVEGKAQVIFLGDHIEESIGQRAIEVEDQASEEYFGVPQTPIWTLRPTPQKKMNELLTSKMFLLEYEGAADIELWAPNNFGVYEALIIDGLISNSPPDVLEIYAAKTGRLASMQLRLTSGDAEFIHLQVTFMQRGPRIALGEGGIPGNFPDRTSLQVFPQGSVAAWTGGAGGPSAPVGALISAPTRTARYTYQFSLLHADEFDPEITDYLWDFGDGQTSTLASPTHVYADFGSYEVTLQVTSDWYTWGGFLTPLVIAEEPPIPPPDPMDFYGTPGHVVGDPNDGFMGREVNGESYATLRSSVGNDFDFESPDEFNDINVDWPILQIFMIMWDYGTSTWNVFRRAIASFYMYGEFDVEPTSGSVFLTPQLNGMDGTLDGSARLVLVTYPRGNPDLAISPNDYQELFTVGGFAASDTKPLVSSLVAGTTVEFPLNLTGLQHIIDKMPVDGPVWFGIRIESDRTGAEPAMNPVGSFAIQAVIHSAAAVTEANRPRLHLIFD